jgi:AbrB family looped-hinge helix DNA binding protein
MQSKTSAIQATAVEATVTSKGQITLPKSLRSQLGLRTGSRIRFSLHPRGGFKGERVLLDLEDNWRIADEGAKARGILSFEKMNQAKARRVW